MLPRYRIRHLTCTKKLWRAVASPKSRQKLKYYNILDWKSRFTLGLNTTKTTSYIKKCFKQKLFGIKFLTKTSWTYTSITSRSGAKELRKLLFLKYYNVLEWESRNFRTECCKKYWWYKKCFKQKLYRIKFPIKNSETHTLSPPGMELAGNFSGSSENFSQ